MQKSFFKSDFWNVLLRLVEYGDYSLACKNSAYLFLISGCVLSKPNWVYDCLYTKLAQYMYLIPRAYNFD